MELVRIGTLAPFEVGDGKAMALKPLEEAAEVLGAWASYDEACELDSDKLAGRNMVELLDEIADCVQACANLAAMVGCSDLTPYMERCEHRNRERGRYDS